MSTELVRLPDVEIDGIRCPMYRLPNGKEAMQDLDIGRTLEQAKPHNIRRVIEANSDDLGDLFSQSEKSNGRPGLAYYLTEEQALFVAAKCRTKAAAAQLKRMIAVYMAARQGNGAAAVAMAQGILAPAPPQSEDPLALALRQNQQIGALLTHAIEQRQELARIQADQNRTASLAATTSMQVGELVANQREVIRELAQPIPLPRTPELPGISTRRHVYRIVCEAAEASGKSQQWVWGKLYERLQAHYGYCAARRAENRGRSMIDCVEEDGKMEWLLAVAKQYLADVAGRMVQP